MKIFKMNITGTSQCLSNIFKLSHNISFIEWSLCVFWFLQVQCFLTKMFVCQMVLETMCLSVNKYASEHRYNTQFFPFCRWTLQTTQYWCEHIVEWTCKDIFFGLYKQQTQNLPHLTLYPQYVKLLSVPGKYWGHFSCTELRIYHKSHDRLVFLCW